MKMILPSDLHQLLGGLAPADFLKRYWQRKPLLIRRAVPDASPPITRAELFELAGRDEVESRVVARQGKGWSLAQGPFTRRELRRPKDQKWTLLVQGVNLHAPAADALMRRFCFVPQVRLDDLMISWATDGGGVGPHFDSYDVFLLQVAGTRRWRVSMQKDRGLLPGVPLKILKSFKAEEEYLLEPGDMLYLPPGAAHDGAAIGECMTCSIGFRAPAAAELARGFLEYQAEHLERPGLYADPRLIAPADPSLLDDGFVRRAERLARAARPTRAAFEEFLGTYMTEPKAQVYFDPPEAPLALAAFVRAVARGGLKLDLKTQMLHRGKRVYVNGESCAMPAGQQVRLLAAARALPGQALPAAVAKMFYSWYEYGWLHVA